MLSGQPATSALIRTRPELAVIVKGPLAAPSRTLDISALIGWLTLRAAELQTRRLESIEANRREDAVGSVVRPASPAIRFVPSGTPLESAVQANAAAPPVAGGRGFERLQPEAPPAPPPVPSETRSDAGAAADGPAASGSTAADASRRHPPPVSHNLFDFLFRSQN